MLPVSISVRQKLNNSANNSDFKMAATTKPTIIHSDDNMSQTKLQLRGSTTEFGDFRDDLARDGYAVIKGAIPRDRAQYYGDKFFQYLENL